MKAKFIFEIIVCGGCVVYMLRPGPAVDHDDLHVHNDRRQHQVGATSAVYHLPRVCSNDTHILCSLLFLLHKSI